MPHTPQPDALKTTLKTAKGFTLIELLIVISVIAILAAIAIPNLMTSRKAANETSAIAALRTLVSSEETFRKSQNPPTYAATLTVLHDASIIDDVLAGGSKSGYDIAPGSDMTDTTYEFTASPQTNAGDRYFYVDQTGVIRVNTDGPADATSSPIQ